MIMKKYFVSLFCIAAFCACTDQVNDFPAQPDRAQSKTINQAPLDQVTAQKKFAKALSKAVSNSLDVRKFLKAEAVAQFDNDYDIFYPLVKNKIVYDNQSLRDILLSYCKDENELVQIEQSLPLLNILVPDLSLFWDFNAEKWNVDDKEVSVICRDDKDNTLYENGENIGKMTTGDIPDFPCLVVKNNERMKVSSVKTRSGEATYEFLSDAFDGSKRKLQTRHYEEDINLQPTEDLEAYVNGSEIMSSVKDAWNEFKNVPNAYQRDYIYYGITKENKPGTLNRYIREKLYRFRIAANAYSAINDPTQDPTLQDTQKNKGYLTNEEIIQKIWTDGNFEFHFKSYISGEDSKEAMEAKLTFTINPRDAFSLEKIHLKHKNSTAFRQSKNFYTVDAKNLRSKWIYPEKSDKNADDLVFTLPWDLYNKSLSIFMFVEEWDKGQTITQEKSVVSEFINKADFSIEGSGSIGKVSLSTKLGYGFSHTKTVSNKATIQTTVESDPLGTLYFQYNDPIIRDEINGTYKLYNVSSGSVVATLLPVDSSK
ncbi:hypothetical protein BACINT_00300 [Bacteroides intestinalis DSM 17393]|jgi:hypothetical protein|uniref:Uncharacterized protein n=3 Tax=Bacteroides intestinalis TaxID=329854 RepID=A0A415MX19_9BACE|nr:hypothetical protein BACINT_00300 [Bacteroides intestinalis DSM 17393]RGJ56214.1 hypothetical protein DXD57_08970 [Bacteroides intestinalis]RHI30826.1 hypothetical protein DW169_16380 [Bacteroides intestinalis]RHL86722.1 hypothetical protein DWZ95_21525 [Bacteroides intestinalis]RYT81376.1 hypothetical protein EAJ06_06730 [Bacteroides intestinalis]